MSRLSGHSISEGVDLLFTEANDQLLGATLGDSTCTICNPLSSFSSRRAEPALSRGWEQPVVRGPRSGAESGAGRGRDKAEALGPPVV